MITKLVNRICIGFLFLLITLRIWGQENIIISGTVYNANTMQPLSGAMVFSLNASRTSLTDSTGKFVIEVNDPNAWLRIQMNSYAEREIALAGRNSLNIYVWPLNNFLYKNTYTSSYGVKNMELKTGNAQVLSAKDLTGGYSVPDDALTGKMAGVQVINKSGTPGEGSVIKIRGLKTFTAENLPLIVVDGIPYFPDANTSDVVMGFSHNIFSPVNMKDVKKITLLKGADAAMYGSLGSNGVLHIETERSNATTTQVQIHTTEGFGVMKKRFPLLNSYDFKSYISDLAETYYSSLKQIVEQFPFLADDPKSPDNYLYGNNTDWQDEIYQTAFMSDNSLRVSGGDAIAKYALSVGTLQNKGIWKGTTEAKYYTHLNADIQVSRNFSLFATAGFNYSEYKPYEQGLSVYTSPLMAAITQAPVYSVYMQDREGNNLPHFNKTASMINLSNPRAIVSDLEGNNKIYDILVDLGANYDFGKGLSASMVFGIYYNYIKESMFIPGNTSEAIASLFSERANTIRGGSGEGINYYFKVNASYNKLFNNIHSLKTTLGYQLMAAKREYDWGQGGSWQSDFYKTLDNVKVIGLNPLGGYIDKWSWINIFLTGSYGYKNQLFVDGTLAFDASSAYGDNHARMIVLPSVKAAWAIKNSTFLNNVDIIDQFTLRAEYSLLANSRYSSKYGRYYYQTVQFRNLSGIKRVGLPNSKLGPEYVNLANIGIDFALLRNRLNLSIDAYEEKSVDMLLGKTMGASYGEKIMYDNIGKLRTRGIELNVNSTILNLNDFSWILGGNIAHYKSEVLNLGNQKERIYTNNDGATLLLRVGESPYQFYGHKAEHVFVSNREAQETGYIASSGTAFAGGDIKFKDFNSDLIIDEKDRTILGSATPDFYGGFFSYMTYKNFSLYANFTYSYGNKIYNAVRRVGESMNSFTNQFSTTTTRWTFDGHGTNMPKAVAGDPMENNRFSSRWIEDGSYLKLKEITLSYAFNRKVWFFNDIKVYITGENLYTWTKYIGLDPEFAYSYDPMVAGMDLGKMPLSKNGKIGLVLNF